MHRKFLEQLSSFHYVIPKLKFSSITSRRLYQSWRKKNHRWFCKRKAPGTKACADILSAKRLSTLKLPDGKCERHFIAKKIVNFRIVTQLLKQHILVWHQRRAFINKMLHFICNIKKTTEFTCLSEYYVQNISDAQRTHIC